MDQIVVGPVLLFCRKRVDEYMPAGLATMVVEALLPEFFPARLASAQRASSCGHQGILIPDSKRLVFEKPVGQTKDSLQRLKPFLTDLGIGARVF